MDEFEQSLDNPRTTQEADQVQRVYQRFSLRLFAFIGLLTVCVLLMTIAIVLNDNDEIRGEASAIMGFAEPERFMSASAQTNLTSATEPNAPSSGVSQSISANVQERLIIQNASLRILADDPPAAANEIVQGVEALGGWVVERQINTSLNSRGQTQHSALLRLRVPAEHLSATLEDIRGLALQVSNETLSGEDVTAQAVDLESQVRNLQAAETQLQSLMQDAEDSEAVLAIFRELTALRGEIERMNGQLSYYREAAAFSALRVDIYPPSENPDEDETGWQASDTFSQATDSALNTLQSGLDALIWLGVYGLLLLAVIALPALGLWLFFKRRQPN